MLSASSLRSKLQNLNVDLSKFGGPSDKPQFTPYDCDKAKVLQEARAFSESPLNPKKCSQIITKILYLLSSNADPLTSAETSTLFFGVTRLFQSSDERLRRLIYMLLKELSVQTAEGFIVTSSLTKDMTSNSDRHRGNAVRVLSRIVDAAMVSQIERYLKTAIVDKNPFVASSGLVAGINLFHTAPDVVRRWVSEVQSCVFQHDKAPIVQAHALVLLHAIKSSDRLALHKSICELLQSFQRNPVAECLLIRYVKELLLQGLASHDGAAAQTYAYAAAPTLGAAGSADPAHQRLLLDYLESCLRHKHEMAMFEAARALCDLAGAAAERGDVGSVLQSYDISGALTVLQILLTSPKPVVRFAAVHVVNKLAQKPRLASVLARCNAELEPLLSDPNRSIATAALTTLLKTGHESGVERLTKQISSFTSDVPDAFKVDVVKAVLQLCLAYPNKHVTLTNFLASNLREEGSVELKTCAVEAIMTVVQQIPQAQELGLLQLCEFIEDCEYAGLCTRILAFLGEQAATTATSSKFIRFIYNRLILENAVVRAAGVDALTKIAFNCPQLRGDVLVLLEGCLSDNDDEVRDRTQLYYAALQKAVKESGEDAAHACMQADSGKDLRVSTPTTALSDDVPSVAELLSTDPPFALDPLCASLESFLETQATPKSPGDDAFPAFDFASLPSEAAWQEEQARRREALAATKATGAGSSGSHAPPQSRGAGPSGSHAYSGAPAPTADLRSDGSAFRDGYATEGGPAGAAVSSAMSRAAVEAELHRVMGGLVAPQTLGPLLLTTKGTMLTEKEAEYAVEVVKHVFAQFLVLEFRVLNTVEGQVLENVLMRVAPQQGAWAVVGGVPIPALTLDQTLPCFVLLKRLGAGEGARRAQNAETGALSAALSYILKEAGDDIGYEDEYPVEPVVVTIGSYIAPKPLRQGEFKVLWDSLGSQGTEAVGKFCLNFRSLDSAVTGLLAMLNLAPCDRSESVDPQKTTQTVLCSGNFLGEASVLATAVVFMSPDHGCLLKLVVRSDDASVCDAILQAFE
ncbi:putative coatomer gamma 2-subunit protein [Neospora caninum Liverpool]|uniref:Coatomer subunit gamma n=1 Tax=Neospora caninum (strain Liverpool) TaxID=572307 RepID=F0VIS9_NEOCL|nr:putative coatomer gamma 2-subunit protein [Neospora caninum Liverpool]CBZ53640.1 putative coatomer gamma 2-subunit protein [Neospora caninum Liverpool]CEL67631.1 TPA: coatomer gamma 2-subunit protein, putative [Neospora caninum Liverpool]|eukprot:XP_003883672.1 putative coatomer gamma 2-subunit protein [Neospora caninum Liverpool]